MKYILHFFVLLVLISCEQINDSVLCFIGDSIVARWDLKESFPNYITENLGHSGAGINYLLECKSHASGKSIIVLIGTNDIDSFEDGYAERYTSYINSIGAKRTIVISILPRNYSDDDENVNSEILKINTQIKKYVEKYGWIYVDAYPHMMINNRICESLYTDGLHLSKHGYEILSNSVKDFL